MKIQRILSALALCAPTSLTHAAQVRTKPVLTIEGAKQVAAAAEAYAKSKGSGSAIAIVDDGGNLLYLERLDGTFAAGANISIGKARTAALFRKPTSFFEDVIVAKGRVSMTALPDFTPLKGGVPIEVDGQIVGAVGVSGAASADQDEEVALAGAGALASRAAPKSVTFIERGAVDAAFRTGAPLLETGQFKVHASRRDAPGQAEVHETDTDIIYVLDGAATLVTGGKVVAPKSSGPAEIRGTTIEGGDARKLAKGDVIVVPAGTPHWFKDVPSPLTYYVVKAN